MKKFNENSGSKNNQFNHSEEKSRDLLNNKGARFNNVYNSPTISNNEAIVSNPHLLNQKLEKIIFYNTLFFL